MPLQTLKYLNVQTKPSKPATAPIQVKRAVPSVATASSGDVPKEPASSIDVASTPMRLNIAGLGQARRVQPRESVESTPSKPGAERNANENIIRFGGLAGLGKAQRILRQPQAAAEASEVNPASVPEPTMRKAQRILSNNKVDAEDETSAPTKSVLGRPGPVRVLRSIGSDDKPFESAVTSSEEKLHSSKRVPTPEMSSLSPALKLQQYLSLLSKSDWNQRVQALNGLRDVFADSEFNLKSLSAKTSRRPFRACTR